MRCASVMEKGAVGSGTISPMILLRRRVRLTAKMLGGKPDCLRAASILARVLARTDAGSWKNFDTVGRDRPTARANSSIVPIFFDRTRAVPFNRWRADSTTSWQRRLTLQCDVQ